jgi:hypothetical protein
MSVPPFDGTVETSVARLDAYLAEALADEFGQRDSDRDRVPVEHVPPPGDSYDLVLGDLRLVVGLVAGRSRFGRHPLAGDIDPPRPGCTRIGFRAPLVQGCVGLRLPLRMGQGGQQLGWVTVVSVEGGSDGLGAAWTVDCEYSERVAVLAESARANAALGYSFRVADDGITVKGLPHDPLDPAPLPDRLLRHLDGTECPGMLCEECARQSLLTGQVSYLVERSGGAGRAD